MQNTNKFLKDIKHILQVIKECEVGENTVLTTADVALLYTNIDHQGAIRAIKWAQDKSNKLRMKPRKCILKCLEFCLNHNCFWFEDDYYLQIKGGLGH